jgi:lysophospholipase L1-like esterase
LQRDFGGTGVGMMPITSVTNDFRITIKHQFSKDWILKSHVTGKRDAFNYGISGEYFIPSKDTSTLNAMYLAKNRQFLSSFPNTILYYGLNDSIESPSLNIVALNGDTFKLTGSDKVNQLALSNQSLKEASLDFIFKFPQPIFGVSFESNNGVLVDNFATRGSAGIPLTLISGGVLNQFNRYLDYDLIILQFGMNVLSGKTNYNWYKSSMKRVINHFKQNLPNTSILVVSIADKSSKNEEDGMSTDPAVPLIVDAQREAARETEVAFFNLYKAMGGENSMVEWVEELEYANKDYTHFNFKGAEFAASLLYGFLMEEYMVFKTQTDTDDE